jgi:D-serine deaminase-like pyridoxal phosphate-dependent protein
MLRCEIPSQRDVRICKRIEIIPPHCDAAANPYDRVYALPGDLAHGASEIGTEPW